MAASLEVSKAEIVLVGQFSPDDAHPARLVDCGAISEAEASVIVFKNLVAGHIVEYSIEWGVIQVLQQRLVINTLKVPYVRVADLALKIVRESMKFAKVGMLGINREFHYKFESTAARDELGKRLAPPGVWGPWGRQIEADMVIPVTETINKHGGLVNITMRQVGLDDRESGWIDAALATSKLVANDLGVSLRINDHYQLDSKKDLDTNDVARLESDRTARLLSVVTSNFDSSIRRSEEIANGTICP